MKKNIVNKMLMGSQGYGKSLLEWLQSAENALAAFRELFLIDETSIVERDAAIQRFKASFENGNLLIIKWNY